VRNSFDLKELRQIGIVGVGLLGGSVGMAARASGFRGKLIGAGRRASSLARALEADAVDEVTTDPAEAATGSDLVVICTPISQFEPILRRVAEGLTPGTYVTDVASAKASVVRLAERILPPGTRFVGSHPMAGSEQTGVEFARADLFQRALCLLTPTRNTKPATLQWVQAFWESLGGRTLALPARRHDQLLAGVSHLPHLVATALVNLASRSRGIRLAGPGFADATRIASGDPGMWADIVSTNRQAILRSVDQLMAELARLRQRLEKDDTRRLHQWLDAGKQARDEWVRERYNKKVLPP
jgi:cyclohexadieny/prephenate dehydrogenase